MSSNIFYGNLSYNIKHVKESIFLIVVTPTFNLYVVHWHSEFKHSLKVLESLPL